MGPWRARLLRGANRGDLGYSAALVILAALSLWSGHAAARYLTPRGASRAASLLEDLETPASLPNAPLTREDGSPTRLFDLLNGKRTLVSFYAPWCGPCQVELPQLVRGVNARPECLVVVVGPDEDLQEVRRKLDNLDLRGIHFHVDSQGALASAGRVTALPTTFLVAKAGRVHERLVGQSEYRLQMLISQATGNDTSEAEADGE